MEDEELSRFLHKLNFPFLFEKLEGLTSQVISQVPKFFNAFINHALPEEVDLDFKSRFTKDMQERIYASGSLIEGCAFSRLLSPSLPGNHIEIECDLLQIFGEISKHKASELIKDLPYARGFAWINYDSEITDLEKCGTQIEGTMYFRASAFRKYIADCTVNPIESSSPSFFNFHQYEAGPSAAVDMNMKIQSFLKDIPSKEELKSGLIVLHKIVHYLEENFPILVTLYRDYKAAEEDVHHFLTNKISSENVLTETEIHTLFCDSTDNECLAGSRQKSSDSNESDKKSVTLRKGSVVEDKQEVATCSISSNDVGDADIVPEVRQITKPINSGCNSDDNSEIQRRFFVEEDLISSNHPGSTWSACLKRLADCMHRVLITINEDIKMSKVKDLLGYQRSHVIPIFEELTKLQKEFVFIHLSLGCVEQKLLHLHAENPRAVAHYMLTRLVQVSGQGVDLYSVVLGIMQQCLRIVPTRLSVMGAACYSYDQIYGNLKKSGRPKENLPCAKNVHEGIIASMDRVPAFLVKEWPAVASSWATRSRSWPSIKIIDAIVEGGCHIVPKPYKGEKGNEELDWRWSFSKPEIMIAKARTQRMTMSYFILKCMFYKYFKAISVDDATLSSYLVKTVMLYESEMHEECWWEDNSLLICLEALVRRFNYAMSKGFLPHYFISDLNLLYGLPEELLMQGNAVAESILADLKTPTMETLSAVQDAYTLLFNGKQDTVKDLSESNTDVEAGKLFSDNKRLRFMECTKDEQDPTSSTRLGAEKTYLQECTNFEDQVLPLDTSVTRETSSEFHDIENIPLLIAKMRKRFACKREEFKGIIEKRGILTIMQRAIAGFEQLYPQATEMANKISVELHPDDNFSLKLPLVWNDQPYHQIPSVTVSFHCGKTVRFNIDLF